MKLVLSDRNAIIELATNETIEGLIKKLSILNYDKLQFDFRSMIFVASKTNIYGILGEK